MDHKAELTAREREGINAMHPATRLDFQIGYIDQLLARLSPAALAESLPEDSPLALPERVSYALSNGEVVDIDLYQISAGCWTAKDANHDSRTGVDSTREKAIADLLEQCEADIGGAA